MTKTKRLCMIAMTAAIYVAMTVVNPVSWGTVQFRISNLIAVLPFFDSAFAPGVLAGIAIANAMSPFGAVDVLFGVGAEAAAYGLCVWGPLKRATMTVKILMLSVSVSLIVGAELTLLYQISFWINAASLFFSTLLIGLAGAAILRPMLRRAQNYEKNRMEK